MTIQLNPTTADAYETKTLAQLRQMVFDSLGFINLLTAVKAETLGAIRADIFNMLGMAAMTAFPPPGVVAMLNSFINEAQQTLFRTVEFGTGSLAAPPVLVNDTDMTVLDGTAVRQLALGMAKAHYGQEDGQIYLQQNAKYLKDLVTRTPLNATSLINRLLKDAQFELYRRYDVFRMERWFSWTFTASQRFYSITSNDERAPIPTPTNVAVGLGAAGSYGSMTTVRTLSSAILLSNGNMLIAGGSNIVGDVASAEVYNPATGFFTSTGNLVQARDSAYIANLPGGLVLVAGGTNGSLLRTTEIYDPVAGTFTQSGNMITARGAGSGVIATLPGGRILFAGGYIEPFTTTNLAEIYDPAAGTFTATGNMTTALTGATGVTLANGNVVVAGGIQSSLVTTSSQLFNSTSGTFSGTTGALNSGRAAAPALLMSNGKVLIAGGQGNGGFALSSCEIYDPAAGTWSTTGSMATNRLGHTLTLLPNGKVLAAGGATNAAGAGLASAEIFDPVAGTWSTVSGGMSTARFNHTAVYSPYTLKVYLSGGVDNSGNVQATMDVYDYATNTFSTSGVHTSTNRSYKVAFVDSNGKTTLASTAATYTSFPGDTAAVITWDIPTNTNAKYAIIYGRTAGTEQRIGQVDVYSGQYIDYGTIVPSGALPTVNNTGNTGPILDQRKISWVGISQGDVNWRPLAKGIPPTAFTNITPGIPQFYDIREQIEVWQPPVSNAWQLRIKGFFTMAPFEADTDVTTLDWQAVYLQAVADAKVAYKQPDANLAQAKLRTYIGDLIAGTHGTARYVPGGVAAIGAVRPLMVDQNGNPLY